jgi:hypothetical protein
MEGKYRIQFVQLETRPELRTSDMGSPAKGSYLQEYDPEFFHGRGLVVWTEDWQKAKTFNTMKEAIEFYRQTSLVRPLRSDGKPNRPLTSCTVTFTKEVPN